METDQDVPTGINATDPVEDPRFPRIREYRPDEDDVEWPAGEPVDTAIDGIEEMLTTAAVASGWGSGWPSCTPAKTDLATVEVNDATGRVVARFPVRRKLARLLDLILDHCARRGYVFIANQCGAYNCLAGETLAMTRDGDVPIRDLSGTSPVLLSGRGFGKAAGGPGRWVESTVRSFGTQPLRRVVLARRGMQREVFATPDHRWLLDEPDRARQERGTDELRPGYRMASVYPQSVASRVGLSSVGITHGIVYGDGTLGAHDSRVMLCGEKNATLLRYFGEPHVAAYQDGLLVSRLPKSWKRLPSREEGSSYLYGFLAGYFAADGSVGKTGLPRLWSADRDSLGFVRVLCTQLGIATTGVVDTKRVGIDGQVSSIYCITLSGRNLTDDFFLIPEHRERFMASPRRYAPARWRVVSVEETDRVEEVFCAVVPESESFALADNLLTGNCRKIAGTNTTSNHARATAIDIMWGLNPHRRPLTTNIPRWMVELLERYLWNWGGRWSTPDAMHFEFGGTPADADAQTARAFRELGGGAVARPVLRRGSAGEPVREVQTVLGVPVTGVFDDATDAAVRAFQRANGLDPDGIVGPATWKQLLEGEEDDMARVEQWKFDRLFDRVLRMSAGIEGEAHDGTQFGYEKRRWEALEARLDKIETALAALKRP